MQLFFKEVHIGDIAVTGGDFPWVHGAFTKRKEYEKFKDFFAFLISSDKKDGDEKAFDEELFDENNWRVKDGAEKTWIFTPHIYDEKNEIGFRYYKFED